MFGLSCLFMVCKFVILKEIKVTMRENTKSCCICLENVIFYQNIVEDNIRNVKCIDKLKLCVPNEDWNEKFIICNDCSEKLDTTYNFIQLCQKNEQYRKEQLNILELEQIKQEEEEAIKFTCHQCNKSFRLKRTLGLHITRIHTRPKKNQKKKLSDPTATLGDVTEEKKDIEEAYIEKCVRSLDDIEENSFNGRENDQFKEENINFSDFEDDLKDNDSNYSSDEETIKRKKKCTGKKRGPKRKGPLKCEHCNLVFERTDRYVQHVRSKHTFEKPFHCDLCDAKYYSAHNLNIHKRKHTNEKPYICASCGKSFTSSNDLWQHNKIHDKVRQYGCNECTKYFKTHSNLRTHKLQMHQDPKMWKFICTVCGKKFPLNNNLIKHMRRHEGIKQFACHLCEKKFVEKIDLQTHLVSHSNERNFKCNLCDKEYKKRETLRRHLKIEHDMGNYNVKKPEKKLNCPMCPKIFAFNNKLQRHILTHTGEKPIKCEYCEKRFRDKYDKNVHLRKDHNVEPKNYMSM